MNYTEDLRYGSLIGRTRVMVDPTRTESRSAAYRQRVVAELGQKALEIDDIDQLMHDASVVVAETLDVDYCKVLELLPSGEEVLLRQGIGWHEGVVGSATAPTDRDSQAGYTLLTEDPVIVDDLRTEGRFSGPELLTSHDVVSGMSVLIGSVEAPWGVLGAHSTERREFTEDDAAFVQNVANILAAAIEAEQTHRRLERTLDLFEKTERTADVGGWAIDTETMELFWTDHLFDILGIADDEEPPLEEALDVYHEADRPIVRDAVENAIDTGESFDVEVRFRTPSGEIRWLHALGTPVIEDGEIVSIRGAAQDVTERKERERELEQYQALTEAANDVIVTIDERSVVRTINPAVTDVFGYDQGELEGESLTELMPDEFAERHHRAVERYLETGERTLDWEYVELPGEHADGSEIPLAISFSETEFEGERFLTGVVRDITERKRYERELEASHDRLEQFASAVSHDLKEPLTTITSYLQLLDRRYRDDLDEEAREFIDVSVNSVTRMRRMLDGIVSEYARVDSRGATFEPVDLNSVLDDALIDLGRKIDESDAEITSESLPRVEGDPGQLHQLLLNLLDNAIKYSGESTPRIDVSAASDGQMWVISVRDEGIGIDPGATETVFEVFQRLHDDGAYPGSGIGLALCRRVVERHGGEIWVESEPGEGSTFSFTLPMTRTRDA